MQKSRNTMKCIFINAAVLVFVFAQTSIAKDCKKPCTECQRPLQCSAGISLVLDECGCCKRCAKQLHDICDSTRPCDHHKNLYCSFGDVDSTTGVCVAKPGRSCFVDGKVYLNGQSFQRGCKFLCTCIDSDIGCQPLCPARLRIPRDCDHPQLIRIPGHCCDVWSCAHNRRKSEVPYPPGQIREQKMRHDFYLLSAAQRRPEIALTVRKDDKCKLQTTLWSPCSKTCGWGVSERVTNDNKACRMRKQTRLCQIRPCRLDPVGDIKKGRRCIRNLKASKPVRYSFSGCKSSVYYPKYCGQCTDGRCCSPERTKTIRVSFHCDDGRSFRKNMLQIKSCSCRSDCAGSNRHSFNPSRAGSITGDTRKGGDFFP